MVEMNTSRRESGALGAAPGAAVAASPGPGRGLWLGFAALSALGVAVSIELTRIHVLVHTDPTYHSVCAVSDEVNCETVAASPYAVFAGLPVAVWGIVGYLVMGALALWAARERRAHPTWPLGILLPLTALSVVASAALAFVSATRIDSLCLFCLGSYVINLGLLALGLLGWRQTRARASELLRADASGLARRPVRSAVVATTAVAALGALVAFVPAYWRTPGWTDLPTLASGLDESGHHWVGARDPALTIVEFTDYECPHCRAAHRRVRALVAEHPEQIRLVHRHLPLDMACHPALRRPFHERACLFAEAVECAGLQGRFWEMNDALFAIQETVESGDVVPSQLAVRLGLNRLEFERCLESHATAAQIAVDVREAGIENLTGTPSFLIGDRLFMGNVPRAQLEQMLAATP